MPKSKIFSCKWCEHKTEQKEVHWEHIKSHIDPKKLLACKSCSFVTEYKHHLDYHHRNHAGLKPYKCDKCDYQCVNRSMLKSHLKSHSPDCPYRCSNCRYSTKYAHSLKMHHKKYHQNQHHDKLMIDVFSPKTEESDDVVTKDGSNSGSPASTNTTISTTTTTSTNGETIPVLHALNLSKHATRDSEPHCILDLRVESKLKAAQGRLGSGLTC